MKLLCAFFAFFLFSNLTLAQSKTPAKSTPTKAVATKSKVKKAVVSPTQSKSFVSSSVVSTSISSTPSVATTIVSTTALSKTTTTRITGNSETQVSQGDTTSEKVTPHAANVTPPKSLSVSGPDPAKPTGSSIAAATTGAIVRRRPLIAAAINATTPNGISKECSVLANDALLVYNLCADGPCGGTNTSALQLRIPNEGKRRKWQYFKASDNVRMNIVSINPSSCTVTLNTAGFQNEFLVNQSPISVFTLTPPSSETTATAEGKPGPNPNANQKNLTDTEKALIDTVTANQQTIAAYTAALQEERRILAAQPCISNEEIVSKLNGRLAGETISRQQLQTNQQNLVAALPATQAALRKTAEEGLAALQAEIAQWSILLAGTMVRGPVMQARDNDYVRFTIKRRCGTNTEETLPTIDIPVYGNFRMNVSTGFLVSGLVDYKYLAIDRGVIEAGFPAKTTVSGSGSTTVVTESTIVNAPISSTSTTTKVPVRDVTSPVNIGIGALLHAYYTSSWAKGTLTPAVTIGASLNAAGRYTLLVGGSIIVGSKQRIVFTGGYALGPVARLQKPFKTKAWQETVTAGNVQTTRNITTAYEYTGAEFPTTFKTQGSYFFAITFNLSSKRNPTPAN